MAMALAVEMFSGEQNKPVALNASPLSMAPVVDLSQTVPVEHDAVPYLKPRIF